MNYFRYISQIQILTQEFRKLEDDEIKKIMYFIFQYTGDVSDSVHCV